MSENNLNKDTELLQESLLLNIDIFSSEFEDEIEEDRVNDAELVEPVEEVEGPADEIENIDPFILSVDYEIEVSEMYKNKKEFNAYMNKFPEKKQKEKIRKENKSKQENKPVNKTKRPIPEIRNNFDFNINPIKKKTDRIESENKTLFDTSKMDSKKAQHSKTKNRKVLMDDSKRQKNMFSMDLDQKEKTPKAVNKVKKNDDRLMASNFNEKDKMNIDEKDYLKIEVL